MEILEQTHGESVNEGHLGGFAIGGDGGTYYPIMWKYLVEEYGVKSVLDVGCGRGYAARFFKSLGCEIRGVDGAQRAKTESLIPEDFIHFDYTTGPLVINRVSPNGLLSMDQRVQPKQFDLGWTCEFVEHVEEKYIPNFMATLSQCKYVAMTFASPGQGGHHHVNENTQDYWIGKFKEYGFNWDNIGTQILRNYALKDKEERLKIPNHPYFISHFIDRGLLFQKA